MDEHRGSVRVAELLDMDRLTVRNRYHSCAAIHRRRSYARCPGPTTSRVARTSADIPGFQPSSGGGQDVCPGGVFVIGGVGLQAAVQDADKAIGELAERGLMTDLAGSELLVVGLCPR